VNPIRLAIDSLDPAQGLRYRRNNGHEGRLCLGDRSCVWLQPEPRFCESDDTRSTRLILGGDRRVHAGVLGAAGRPGAWGGCR
jgi:hypothetical protein